ncbi:MAG: glycosyltransferase [Holophaga sp.]
MKLLVVIPTWNRADCLDKAIQAISEARSQTQKCTVELFISDNCSSDHTSDVTSKWQQRAPWIHVRRWETHTSHWGEILERALLHSGLEFDYLWLQGDDDLLFEASAYQQLAEALEASAEDPPAVVHCCPIRRALPGEGGVFAGTTEDLCNTFGWYDLLGWISSLVVARDTVVRMMASPQWQLKPPSTFVHSEALLEAAYGRTMLILTTGFIDPQDEEATPDTIDRWLKEDVLEGFWNIIPGIANLKRRGVLTEPLTLGFFRHLTYSLWDRFAIQLMSLASKPDTPAEELVRKMDLMAEFASLLGYGEDRKLYENWFEGFQDDIKDVRRAMQVIQRRIAQHKQASYAYTLMPPGSNEGR